MIRAQVNSLSTPSFTLGSLNETGQKNHSFAVIPYHINRVGPIHQPIWDELSSRFSVKFNISDTDPQARIVSVVFTESEYSECDPKLQDVDTFIKNHISGTYSEKKTFPLILTF